MKHILLTLFLFFAFSFFGCSSSDEIAKENSTQVVRSGSKTNQTETQSDTYILRQGDQIQLSVWGYPEFNSTGIVRENGMFTVPLVGDILAIGLTKEQFIERLQKKLAEYIQGEIKLSVTVMSVMMQKVAVLGTVTKQDNYPVTADMSLLEILTLAGGTTPDSDLRHIKILRSGVNHPPIDVDLASLMESGNLEAMPIVRPGDTVFVPKKENVVRDLSDFVRDAIFIFSFFRVFN
jgi:polysaccharide export outer membrane protein